MDQDANQAILQIRREIAELRRQLGQMRSALGATTAEEAEKKMLLLSDTINAVSSHLQATDPTFRPPVSVP